MFQIACWHLCTFFAVTRSTRACSQIPRLATVLTTIMSLLLCHQHGVRWLKVKVSIFPHTIFGLFADGGTRKAISIMAKNISFCSQGFSRLEMTLDWPWRLHPSPSLNDFWGGDLQKTLTSCSLAARLLASDANSVGVGWISNGVLDFPGQ